MEMNLMDKLMYLLFIGILLTFGAACELVGLSTGSDAPVEGRSLVGPTWQLVAFEKTDGDRTPIDYGSVRPEYRDTAYTVVFTKHPSEECIAPEELLYGAWCADLIGYPNESPSTTYDSDSTEYSLTIYFRGTTFVGQPSGSKETEFFMALDAATSYRIEGNRLRVAYGDGKSLIFEAEASASD